MAKKTMPSVRIAPESYDNIKRAITKLNETQLIPLSQSDFQRLALEFLAQTVLQGKPLPKLTV